MFKREEKERGGGRGGSLPSRARNSVSASHSLSNACLASHADVLRTMSRVFLHTIVRGEGTRDKTLTPATQAIKALTRIKRVISL